MFNKKINKKVDMLTDKISSIHFAIAKIFGVVGGDIYEVKDRVRAMERYFGVKFLQDDINGSKYIKAPKVSKKINKIKKNK